MNLHLLIPGLLWPDTELPEVYRDLSLSALETILAKSRYKALPPQAMEAWLCQAFDVSKQQDWPVAPIMLHMDGKEAVYAQNAYWLRADPVHLRIENNHILLADNQLLRISLKESTQLADTLNEYFNKDGIVFLPLQPDRWYVRINKTPHLYTRLLSEMVGKNINNQLPTGEDISVWHTIFNETQMLLYDHPVNQEREIHGELAINSLWFWGGGVMPQPIHSNYDQVWSDHPFAQALAIASGITHAPLPHDAIAWQRQAKPGNHLVVLDTLWGKTQYKNIYEWRQCLDALENSWFTPLLDTIKKGKMTQLTITALNENYVKNYTVTPNGLWKFWARKKPLSNYAKN
jgi:hypothetical protein